MAKTRKAILEQYDRIVDVWESIPLDGSVSVLTGRNGSGKSLIRQQLIFRVRKKVKGGRIYDASMQRRTAAHAGGLGAFMRDTEWDPTSLNTLHFIKQTMNRDGGLVVLDEIEVGCGEETVMALVDWLNANLREGIKDAMGCVVITHSPYVVEHLKFDHWFNLDGFDTPEAWLNRTRKPTDMDQLWKDSRELFLYVTQCMKESKGKK